MPDEPHNLVELPGSARTRLEAATPAGQLDTSERAELTLVLRRRAEIPAEIVEGPAVLTHDELRDQYGADPADVDLVRQTLGALGLEVTEVHASTRRVRAAGTIGALSSAFGVTLQQVSSPDPKTGEAVMHRYREGPLFVPAALDGVVVAVLGLDTRPQARPHFRRRGVAPHAAAAGSTYPPNQVAGIYKFPAGTTGAGQTIAIIELGGGFSTSDLDTYFGGLGIAVPSISAVSVDGASNAPGSDPNGADIEVALDIDVIGAAAPGATQIVYFAPNDGDQGFVDAISAAASATPAPIAISISWGQSEDSWTAQGRIAMDAAIADAAAMGITVCVASGDNGSGDAVSDGQSHVDFPASSPHALACGGTKLMANPSTGVISSEVVWNETAANEGAGGGGVSDHFAVPSFQANAGVPARAARSEAVSEAAAAGGGRGVPDVAGNADPVTGYQVFSGGQAQVVGGTSAVAPLWAALVSRLAEATGQRFGLIQTLLYAGVSPGTAVDGFNDITSGNNGAYAAGPGWDACSGLGSPDGTALLNRLKS
ncbi:MAG TPA: S53 family peptidase [Streptosporangiaceae bacterium]|nr:S53 family peptidase [Streptosporangiaceae bacterium]